MVTARLMGATLAVCLMSWGCGGSGKKAAEEPVQPEDGALEEDDEPDYEPVDDTLVPPEKFDAINQSMNRKGPAVSRCFADAIQEGRVSKNSKGTITVALVVTKGGDPKDVKVLPSSTIREKAMEGCVIDEIKHTRFTTLPKDLDFTYTYRLERDY